MADLRDRLSMVSDYEDDYDEEFEREKKKLVRAVRLIIPLISRVVGTLFITRILNSYSDRIMSWFSV